MTAYPFSFEEDEKEERERRPSDVKRREKRIDLFILYLRLERKKGNDPYISFSPREGKKIGGLRKKKAKEEKRAPWRAYNVLKKRKNANRAS